MQIILIKSVIDLLL